jgi:hypothetical protein
VTHQVPVGLSKKNVSVKVCAAGLTKLHAHAAKIQYRKAEGRVTHGNFWRDAHNDTIVRRTPYVFARFISPVTGRTARPELGKFLLGASLPVAHLNADPLDFTLENLEARTTEKQKQRAATAQAKRADREAKAKKHAERFAKRRSSPPDGLTPDEQVSVLFDEQFQRELKRIAGAIVRDSKRTGTAKYPTDERRVPELLADVTVGVLKLIRAGQIKNVRAYVKQSVRTQARNERARSWYGMGHVRRPRPESHTLSDIEERGKRK